jgi:hypothetical protein
MDQVLATLLVAVVLVCEFGVPLIFMARIWRLERVRPRPVRIFSAWTITTIVQGLWAAALLVPALAVAWFKVPGIAVFTFAFIWVALGGVVSWRALEHFIQPRGSKLA